MCIAFQNVFEYFTERTPRSHFEHRETSFVWNYKYAGMCLCLIAPLVLIREGLQYKSLMLFSFSHCKDVEFGRLQARDMLQHLWTGPISNAAVDVVQGSRSVEVRSVGVTKVSGSV